LGERVADVTFRVANNVLGGEPHLCHDRTFM
jgi:hypothetical protein